VHCKNLLVDDGCNWQAVEAIGECLPEFDVVTTLALIVEPVYSVDAGAFVIAAQHEEVLGVLDLVCKKQADGLERLLAAIDIVTQEKVVGFWREAAVLKEAKEIVVLSVDIATDLSCHEHQDLSPRSRSGCTVPLWALPAPAESVAK
jgi:hypothetical protein